MTSLTNSGGGGGLLCACWFGGGPAISMASFEDSSIANLLWELICVVCCWFEFVFGDSILRFFALLASLARGDLLSFPRAPRGGVARGSDGFAQASLVVIVGPSSS